MNAMLEPRMVAARIHGPAVSAQRAAAVSERMTPSSHGGMTMFAIRCETLRPAHGPGLSLVQHLMDEGDGNRPFADRRRHALETAAAHVADGEDAGQAGFEKTRRAR